MKKKKFYLCLGIFLAILILLPLPQKNSEASKDPDLLEETIINSQIDNTKEGWVEVEFEVTMYTLGECGKSPGHPAYGITKNRKRVLEGRTVAASPEIPFGSKVKISGFKNIFTVEDRGGKIKTNKGYWPGLIKIDIYTTDKEWALSWGRKRVKGKILVQKEG